MKYKAGGLKKLTQAADEFVDVFKKIVKTYLLATAEDILLYDSKELNRFVGLILSDENFSVTPELVEQYFRPLPVRPHVSELIHQQFLYRLVAKKCLSFSQNSITEGDNILFSALTNVIKANLDVLKELHQKLENSEYVGIDDDLEILSIAFKANFIAEIRKEPVVEAQPSAEQDVLTAIETPVAGIIGKFDGLFSRENPVDQYDVEVMQITRNDTVDSVSGEVIDETIITVSPVRSSRTTALMPNLSSEEVAFTPVAFV